MPVGRLKVGLELDQGWAVQVDARSLGAVGHRDEVCPEGASFIERRQVARGGEPQSDEQEDRTPAQDDGGDPLAPPSRSVATPPASVPGSIDHVWGRAITTNRGAVA